MPNLRLGAYRRLINIKPISHSKTITFYNTISPFYGLIDLFLWKGKKQLCNQVNKLPKSVVLEAGIGNASHLHLLNKHTLYGIDIAEKMLQKAVKRNIKNVQLSNQNAENTSFENEFFDIIIFSHVLSVSQNPEQLLKEAYRILKPNGQLFILNHNTTKGLPKLIDRVFNSISSIFNYSSYFCIENLDALQLFTKVDEQSVFMNNYITIQQYKK